MSEYRIVSNRINYKVQWLGKTWLFRRPKWYWLYKKHYSENYIAEFYTLSEANSAIEACIKKDKTEKQGYISIN
ncbi:MAG TPA: hypothetical protein ENH85_06205 [Candidatus Scalindua sp.]|nr:hypothetical protein [Candidatus Scalindua sp.]